MAYDSTQQKFTILFNWFDQTHDGRLTRADFEQTGEVFAAVVPDGDEENKRPPQRLHPLVGRLGRSGRPRRPPRGGPAARDKEQI
ncbi:hypothetical protein C1I98_13810 [Spongiactinospora gelatinilytica]|uniref:EF-hand domain-containing protein n=1 Tax=Spongiactinospora gelatinilytica TaxID=2666298 RepID=A0A2W2I976_9ACTN|nr:hypothetical protein [Spongiactinospora gelatinilytica]PZG46984.1 hypothetical protein C1I98_13810 [Spongiactinospora gelatinilytica]